MLNTVENRNNVCLQSGKENWRNLSDWEIAILEKNNNFATEGWSKVLVNDDFQPNEIRNSQFEGEIRIGSAKISNSCIRNCDVLNKAELCNVGLLDRYVVSENSKVFNVCEISVSEDAAFGTGSHLNIMNEGSDRTVLAFNGMLPADAYLWGKYRGDACLQKALNSMTNKLLENLLPIGIIGKNATLCNSKTIRNTRIGDFCKIDGITTLSELTVNSSETAPTLVSDGAILKNGIVSEGCKVLENSILLNFILGSNVTVEHGARIVNTYVSDNSTIACCEVQNSLIFPSHEQHHNNSFLIASTILGQSNLAAGATVGSNHNSRSSTGEILAGRGFWPGLCTSLKHSSKFASFTLLSKADYPSELNITTPFSLVNNNTHTGELEVMPAYWWMYNMYALIRNSWKFKQRDRRVRKAQHIEYETFAPDTIEEIVAVMDSLGKRIEEAKSNTATNGHSNGLEVFADEMEHGKRKVRILKPVEAYEAYNQMLVYYAVANVQSYAEKQGSVPFEKISDALYTEKRVTQWINFGGQLIAKDDADRLCSDIKSGKLESWQAIHHRYDELWQVYPLQKARHAYGILCLLSGKKKLTQSDWDSAKRQYSETLRIVKDRIFESRKKDFDNPFIRCTYDSEAEMTACLGSIDDDVFIKDISLS